MKRITADILIDTVQAARVAEAIRAAITAELSEAERDAIAELAKSVQTARTVSLGAVASETPRAPLGRRHKLAMELASLAAEEGLDAAFEAIERGLMGMSVLPDDADVREDLRELSESIDIAAERLGLRGGQERG